MGQAPRVRSLAVMLQKEVAERILSEPGNRDWGVLGIYSHLYGELEKLAEAPADRFKPEPKVDSAVIRINFRSGYPFEIRNYELFRKLIKSAFGNRRKMLKNSLSGFNLPFNCDLDLRLRPEELRGEDFAQLTALL
jgi:16S rRNA (adenine1518-N6/adenine1519-N6)-dimethyltransferase